MDGFFASVELLFNLPFPGLYLPGRLNSLRPCWNGGKNEITVRMILLYCRMSSAEESPM